MLHTEIIIDNHYKDFNPVQFGYETCSPGCSYGPAVRSNWALYYIVSGFGRFAREGKTYDIHPGQIFVIPPYLETFYQADDKLPWKYVFIGFTAKTSLDVFSQPVISCHDAGAIFDEMLSCSNLDNGKSAFLTGCLWKLVSVLSEDTESKPDYITKALSYMHANYSNKITVQNIAELLGLDRSYFYTLFTEQVGTPPSEYLINLRLSKAVELMNLHGERPSTAAISVGYDDLSHFSNTFKKYYGMSPREYLKKAKGIQ